MKLPWVKWYPRDWLSETSIAKTTLAARGLWAEALNVMIASDTFFIEGNRAELARILRCNESELHTALICLQSSKVGTVTFASNGSVTLTSRRLLRQQKARENGRSRVVKHRVKLSCNATTPSVSISDSASSSGRGGGGTIAKFRKPEFGEMEFHALKIGLPPTEINKFFNHYESNGWKVGRVPMRSWQAAMVNWRDNYRSGTYAARNQQNNKPNPRNAGIATDPREQGRKLAEVAARRALNSKPLSDPLATKLAAPGLPQAGNSGNGDQG